MTQPNLVPLEYGRETTSLTEDEVMFLKAFVQGAHLALMHLPVTLTGAIMQSLLISVAMTTSDPVMFIDVVARNTRETVPRALRDAAAGRA